MRRFASPNPSTTKPSPPEGEEGFSFAERGGGSAGRVTGGDPGIHVGAMDTRSTGPIRHGYEEPEGTRAAWLSVEARLQPFRKKNSQQVPRVLR